MLVTAAGLHRGQALHVQFRELGLRLRGCGQKTVLQGVTGELPAGRVTAIMGPSGERLSLEWVIGSLHFKNEPCCTLAGNLVAFGLHGYAAASLLCIIRRQIATPAL